MSKKFTLSLAGSLVALMLITSMGCSLLGLGIGAISDASKPKQTTLLGMAAETVNPGAAVELTLKDGSRRNGKFVGIKHVPVENYEQAYNRSREQRPAGVLLPALGDRITVVTRPSAAKEPEKFWQVDFHGFDHDVVRMNTKVGKERQGWALSSVSKIIDPQNNEISGETITKLLATGQIPVLAVPVVAVQEAKELTQTAVDQIQQIQITNKRNGKLTGFLVGAGIDVVVLAITAASFGDQGIDLLGSSESGGASCPFVYSFNGEKYVLDSETFGGAIFKAAQRTDWDNLDHLCETAGTYRLKLTNELQETQYVDEFKLLVIDHPAESKVMPTFAGELHTLSALQAPRKAVDQNGNNVLNFVSAKDDQIWVSNPFGCNPENKANGRDAIELEFSKPQNAAQVKLAFNVQNTTWASYMQGQMLSLHGRELENWYALMNGSPIAQAALKQAMIREGMLLVQLWNGSAWQICDFVWEVGPSLPKDQVVQLDLRNFPGQDLRVRLESTVGFWMINNVQADYSTDLPIQITELAAQKAVDHLGNDLKDVLQKSDGWHYAMPTMQDWAEITFIAPPLQKNIARTFMLKSTGYYTIHVDAKGEPQRELLTRLMAEPGAYGQYTLRVLNQNVAAAFSQIERH